MIRSAPRCTSFRDGFQVEKAQGSSSDNLARRSSLHGETANGALAKLARAAVENLFRVPNAILDVLAEAL